MRITQLFKSFLKSNKGVEGLPLKYVIIILVAALVIGIAIIMATTLQGGIEESTANINKTLSDTVDDTLGDLPGVGKPTASLSFVVGDSTTTPTTFDGTSADDKGIIIYRLDVDGDGAYDYNQTTSAAFSHQYAAIQDYTATLLVEDGDGNSDTTQVIVQITA